MAAKKAAKKSVKKSTKSTKKASKKSASKKQSTSKRITQETTSDVQPQTSPSQNKKFPTIAVVSAIAFVVIVILAAVAITTWVTPANDGELSQDTQSQTIVVVNGQSITAQEIDAVRTALGPQAAALTEEEIIDQLILQTLLLQEAQERGIDVSAQQAEAEFEELIAAQGMTREQFAELLAAQGQDINVLLEEYRKNLMLEALADEVTQAEITDAQAREFYAEYSEVAGENIPPFEELEAEIYNFLEEQARAQALTELAEQLESEAVIERN